MENARKILIVDDEKHIPVLVRTALKRHGYDVTVACDGIEALKCVAADRPDLVVLDVSMPNMNGFEVLRRLKASITTCSIRVIMLTARDMAEDVREGWQQGADAYLVKPFDPAHLVDVVKSVLGDAPPGAERPASWPESSDPTRRT